MAGTTFQRPFGGQIGAVTVGGSGSLTPTGIKTANYSAVSGDDVWTDTSGGPFTVTLPTLPQAQPQYIGITDVKGGAGTGWPVNNLILARGGGTGTIDGASANATIALGRHLEFKAAANSTAWIQVTPA